MKTLFLILLAVELAFARTAFGQAPDDALRSEAHAIRYPLLAEAARIKGDVHLRLSSGAVTVISGHPLLVHAAEENAKTLGSVEGQGDLDVTYHFVIINLRACRETRVKKGDAFDRAILRMLRLKTEATVSICDDGIAPLSDLWRSGQRIEIWVWGRDRRIETESGTLIARR